MKGPKCRPVPAIGGSVVASTPVFIGGAFDQQERGYMGDPTRRG